MVIDSGQTVTYENFPILLEMVGPQKQIQSTEKAPGSSREQNVINRAWRGAIHSNDAAWQLNLAELLSATLSKLLLVTRHHLYFSSIFIYFNTTLEEVQRRQIEIISNYI